MKLFSKCILLFILLLLLGCSTDSDSENQQVNSNEKNKKTGNISGITYKIKEKQDELLSLEQIDEILNLFEHQFDKEFVIVNYDGSHIIDDKYVNLSIASKDNSNYIISTLKYLDNLYIDRYDIVYYEISQYQKRADSIYKEFYSSLFNIDIILSSYTLGYSDNMSEIKKQDILNFEVGPAIINIAIKESDREKLECIINNLNDTLKSRNAEKHELIFNVYVVDNLNEIKRNTDLAIRNNEYAFTIRVDSSGIENERKFNYNSYYTNYLTKYSLAESLRKIK